MTQKQMEGLASTNSIDASTLFPVYREVTAAKTSQVTEEFWLRTSTSSYSGFLRDAFKSDTA